MANTINLQGEFQLGNRYDVLNVVSNGNKSYVCVRANSGHDVTDTQYWMLLAQGTPGRDGKDGDRGPSGNMADTVVLQGDTNLNFTTSNGFYVKTAGTIINGPSGISDNITILVYGTDAARVQVLTSVSDANTYVRSCKSGTWTGWRQITQWS